MSVKTMNPDTFDELKTGYLNAIANAIRSNDEEGLKAALTNWQNHMSDVIKASYEEYAETADRSVLASRGVRQLTQEENAFYESFIANAKNEGVITGIMGVLPETIFEDVVSTIRKEHPLLSAVKFVNTGAAVKWVMNNKATQTATWGALNSAITKKLEGEIDVIDLTQCKLTAYMFCTRDMLDLGPRWTDAYVRATLSEALATGLEVGIVDGSGLDEPIGMTRNFKGSYSTSTGWPRKAAKSVTDFGISTYAAVLSDLAKDHLGEPRAVSDIILVVNPADYYTTVMPATTLLTPDGKYTADVFPRPTNVIQSVGVPTGHAVMGIGKNYSMFVGSGKGGKIERSDEFKWLDDLATFKIKFFGNGRAQDINSFVYLDISAVKGVYLTVNVNEVKGTVKTKEQS